MILKKEEIERFYRIWWSLLRYTNAREKVMADLPELAEEEAISMEAAFKIRSAIWADDSILDSFTTDNPASFSQADIDLIKSWKHRIEGKFIIFRYLKSHTVFLDLSSPTHAYAVLGLISPIDEIIGPSVPVMVDAVLLPFEGKIIYDSLLIPYSIFFGGGMEEDFRLAYRDAKEREGVITSLPALPESESVLREKIADRNKNLIAEFQKALRKSNLGNPKIEEHVNRVASFGRFLADGIPPVPLLEITVNNVNDYLRTLTTKDQKSIATSLKRFVRFLSDSMRLHPGDEWDIKDSLKLYTKTAK